MESSCFLLVIPVCVHIKDTPALSLGAGREGGGEDRGKACTQGLGQGRCSKMGGSSGKRTVMNIFHLSNFLQLLSLSAGHTQP